ncbi:MAG: amidohydrolase [Saprospiraceae bacterium]
MKTNWSFIILLALLVNCKNIEKADFVVVNARIYTADSTKMNATAMAIKGNRFLAVGNEEEIKIFIGSNTQKINLNGAFVMPGIIEGHGHFLGLGSSLKNLNLLQTKYWQEIVDSVAQHVGRTAKGVWIEGRGWHQDKWKDKFLNTYNAYPYHDALSKISPDNPVVLYHASGHALIANAKAMEIAGITSETQSPAGGRIVKDKDKKLTGVFEENAMDLINLPYEAYVKSLNPNERLEKLKLEARLASEKALEYGITSFQDAGSSLVDMDLLYSLCMDKTIHQRMYVMLYEPIDSMIIKMQQLPFKTSDANRFKSVAVKTYMDGALGSYGAWLMEDYADNPGSRGQNIIDPSKIKEMAQSAVRQNLQLCVHAIGDRANKEVLDICEEIAQNDKQFSSRRWRIEHAQHLRREDLNRFYALGVIASMQAIHCTSDAPFVAKRLGEERAKSSSYVWRSLLDAHVHLANGTDTPVENVNPFECMYAALTRKRLDNGFCFHPEECMTRDEMLKSYTIWNAYASKDETQKGSISPGKLADFIVVDRDLFHCPEIEIASAKVLEVYMDGKKLR